MSQKTDNAQIAVIKQFLITQSESDNQIKEALDNLETSGKSFDDLWKYIMFRARKEIKGQSGYLSDDTVFGWSLHYLIEDKKSIDDEMHPIKEPTKSDAKSMDAESDDEQDIESDEDYEPKEIKKKVSKPKKPTVAKKKSNKPVIDQKKKLEEIQRKKFNARENDLNEGLFALDFED
jgi:hypothetical protein